MSKLHRKLLHSAILTNLQSTPEILMKIDESWAKVDQFQVGDKRIVSESEQSFHKCEKTLYKAVIGAYTQRAVIMLSRMGATSYCMTVVPVRPYFQNYPWVLIKTHVSIQDGEYFVSVVVQFYRSTGFDQVQNTGDQDSLLHKDHYDLKFGSIGDFLEVGQMPLPTIPVYSTDNECNKAT